MAVSDILFAFNGSYVPTGVYSFEYRTGSGRKIAEIYFMLPPKSISWDESQRSVLLPTLTGGYLSDYGNEFKSCIISGECHFYYVGNPKMPASAFGISGGIGSAKIPAGFVNGLMDGYTEYRKLLFMCMRYRDYTLTRDGKIVAPDFSGQALASVNALKNHVRILVSTGAGALSDKIVTIWHDYDKDDHFFVRIANFRSVQEDSDPWSIQWTTELEAYAVDVKNARRAKLSGTTVKKLSYQEIIDKWNKVIANTHVESQPEERIIVTPTATMSVPNYVQGETLDPASVVTVPGLSPS
jgi:hypothetical protein